MAGSTRYGVRAYPFAVELRQDQRRRHRRGLRRSDYRGAIRAWSKASFRRLQLVALNSDGLFRSLVTLTYRAPVQEWETDLDRNRRVVKQSKEDLHRFLMCMRRELGKYLWVQEFQERGVIHYHLLSTEVVAEERATLAWVRASGQFDDVAVRRHSVNVRDVRSERGARSYLGRYIGKERQKCLPKGIDGAGRWWGRSRDLQVITLGESCWLDTGEEERDTRELFVSRCLRRYLSKVFGFKFRGGVVFDFGGERVAAVPRLMEQLRSKYGELVGATNWRDESAPVAEAVPNEGAEDVCTWSGRLGDSADWEGSGAERQWWEVTDDSESVARWRRPRGKGSEGPLDGGGIWTPSRKASKDGVQARAQREAALRA